MIKKMFYILVIISLVFSISTLSLAQEVEAENLVKNNASIFTAALNDYNDGNFALAEEKLNNLLKNEKLEEGLEFSVLYYLTMTAVNRGQTSKAVSHLERLNQLGFQSGNLNWKIAELYLNKNNQFDSADFEKALDYLKKAEELELTKIEFKRDLAYAYFENKKIDKAEKIYQQLIKENAIAEDYLSLAKINKNRGISKKAIEYYEAALNLNGSQSSLYLNLANLYQESGDYESAISIFDQGIKMRDDFVPYYIGLGESYIKLNKYNKASSALKKAISINPNSYYGYYLLGNVEKEIGNLDKALNLYSQSLKYNPDYVQAYLAEGKIHLEKEEVYRAISRFSLAVEKNPDYASSRYYLGKAYYKADMLEAARSELRKALHISDNYQLARDLLNKIEAELNIK